MKGISKISLALASVAALVIFSSTGSAQSAKAMSVGIAGGAAIPVGDFADFYTTGYNGTVFLGFKSVGSPIGIRIDGMYNKMSVKDDASISIPGVGFVEAATISSANANLVYSLPGTGISPYLIGGGGIYGLRLDVDGGDDPDMETDFGVNGGIGASFPLSGFNTFIEARLHHIFTENRSTQFIPVTFGISF
ncbi:MAG TPA: outer membrane beta-barrel protein [Terriglobia bacterium]|nr:outer membrane beta-barrel protein [Terriglobia bacterium]